MSSEGSHCRCHNLTVSGEPTGNIMGMYRKGHFHGLDCADSPAYKISKDSIAIANHAMATVEMIGSNQCEVTCLECGDKLHIDFNKVSYCKFIDPYSMSTSVPVRRHSNPLEVKSIPSQFTQYFKSRDNFDPINLSHPIEYTDTTIFLDDSEEDSDFEIMFSRDFDPVVGSYAELGKFTHDSEYLVFAD